ncbi:pilus assembly protein TadG-related protein [Actinomycetota bacterium]
MSGSRKNFLKQEGQVVVIVAILIIVFVGMTALVVDVGSLYQERRDLQTVADAAALAGAQELPDRDEAKQKAIEYAENYRELSSINIEVIIEKRSDDSLVNDKITVKVDNPNTPLYFAKIWDIQSTEVGASATAIVGEPIMINNVVPWGVKLDPGEDWNEWLSGQTEKTLKYGPQSDEKTQGNFYALDLDPNEDPSSGGENEYYPRIVDGYDGPLKVGDWIWTEPGVGGKTGRKIVERLEKYGDGTIHDFDELVEDGELIQTNGQFVMVPVIHKLVDPKGQENIEILAFAPFIITEHIPDGHNKGDVIGKFVSQALLVTEGSVDPFGGFGLRVIRLIE